MEEEKGGGGGGGGGLQLLLFSVGIGQTDRQTDTQIFSLLLVFLPSA